MFPRPEGAAQPDARRRPFPVIGVAVAARVVSLSEGGAELSGEPVELGFGRGVMLRLPGADDVLLYQPHHNTAYALE